MDILSIILLAIGLAMDCFAISIAQGIQGTRFRPAAVMALFFGLFQGGMPLIAYYAGALFADFFIRWSPWIALVLLSMIGGKMLWDAYRESRHPGAEQVQPTNDAKEPITTLTMGTILLLAVATSIDALSIGVLFIPEPDVLWLAVSVIAATSTLFSLAGYALGKTLGKHLPFNAAILGGCILIAIGIKIFVEGVFL